MHRSPAPWGRLHRLGAALGAPDALPSGMIGEATEFTPVVPCSMPYNCFFGGDASYLTIPSGMILLPEAPWRLFQDGKGSWGQVFHCSVLGEDQPLTPYLSTICGNPERRVADRM